MAQADQELTTNQILNINSAFAFLFPKEIEKIGVDMAWDIAVNQNALNPIVKMIHELGAKINQEFYEKGEDENGPMRIIKEKEEACREAEKALNEKKFKIQLKKLSLEKLKAIEGVTVSIIFQLHPILTR